MYVYFKPFLILITEKNKGIVKEKKGLFHSHFSLDFITKIAEKSGKYVKSAFDSILKKDEHKSTDLETGNSQITQ